jgi:hypothetical protein
MGFSNPAFLIGFVIFFVIGFTNSSFLYFIRGKHALNLLSSQIAYILLAYLIISTFSMMFSAEMEALIFSVRDFFVGVLSGIISGTISGVLAIYICRKLGWL